MTARYIKSSFLFSQVFSSSRFYHFTLIFPIHATVNKSHSNQRHTLHHAENSRIFRPTCNISVMPCLFGTQI